MPTLIIHYLVGSFSHLLFFRFQFRRKLSGEFLSCLFLYLEFINERLAIIVLSFGLFELGNLIVEDDLILHVFGIGSVEFNLCFLRFLHGGIVSGIVLLLDRVGSLQLGLCCCKLVFGLLIVVIASVGLLEGFVMGPSSLLVCLHGLIVRGLCLFDFLICLLDLLIKLVVSWSIFVGGSLVIQLHQLHCIDFALESMSVFNTKQVLQSIISTHSGFQCAQHYLFLLFLFIIIIFR